MKKVIVVDARGGALGDEICIEPIVRYICEMGIYDVRILSGYREVFEHLKRPTGLVQEEVLSINEEHSYIHACPSIECEGKITQHPFVFIAQPLLCHPVDFVSLFMLRRMIPDEAKRPRLSYSSFALKKVKELIPQSIDVAFHIGPTEKCRDFPQEYAQKVIDALEKNDIKVAIFGKKNKHLHNIECKINLVDKFDLEMFFAFIDYVPITLTNDSSPVHISGAFDNHLIVIPTIRHPDRLVHVRHGSRYYKTEVLYKKLMFDDRSFPLENLVGDRDWSYVENCREDFLPNIETIVASVLKIKSLSTERG